MKITKNDFNIILNIIGNQGIALMGNFIIFLLVSFYFGPKIRGEFAFLVSTFLLFTTIFGFGIGKTIPNFFYQEKYTSNEIIFNYIIILVFLSFLGVVSFLIFMFYMPNIFKINKSLIISYLPIFPYLIWIQNSINIFTNLNILKKQVKISSFLLIMYIIILNIFIFFFKINFQKYLILHSISFFFFFIIDIKIIYNCIGKYNYTINFKLIKSFFTEGSKIFIENIVGLSNSTFYFLLLAQFFTLEIIGNFSFSTQILGILNMPALIMHQFYLNKNIGNKDYWQFQKRQLPILFLIFILFILFTIIAIILLNPIIKTFGFNYFKEIFIILIFSSMLSYFSYFMYSQWLIRGYFLKYSINNLLSFIFTIPISFFMMKYFGILGASISFSFIYLFSLPGNVYLFLHLGKGHK